MAVGVLGWVTVAPESGQAAVAAPVAQDQGQGEQTASKRAVDSKKRVEVVEKRTETARTFANPDGTFTLEQSNIPLRTKRDGQWVDLDASLSKGADGRVRPKAAAMEMSFSGGGTGELISMKSDGHELTLSWPVPLPEPTISGDNVTYQNVFPDVDLKITADTSSYSEVLVVKTPQAARLPQLQRLDFAVKAPSLQVAKVAGGVVLAKDKFGKVIFTSPAPVMWDSRGAGKAPTDEDRSELPLEGDKVVPVPLEVGKKSLKVSPAAALVNDAAVKYPIYLDPAFHSSQVGRAMINQHNPTTASWQWEGPEGVGYQDFEPWSRKRLIYHMRIAGLQYTHITKAVFSGYETWAASCTKKEVQLWKTSAITPSITWNSGSGTATWLKEVSSVNDAVGRDGCTPGGKWLEFDATTIIAEQAGGGSQYAYLGLRAASESDPTAWKRFGKAVRLDVIYNHVPTLSNAHATSPTMGCPTSTAPAKVSQNSPVPTVTIVDPDLQPSRVDFEFRVSGATSTLWTGSSMTKASGKLKEFSPGADVTPLPENQLIGWRARAYDGIDYSAWSGYCWFIVDMTEPPPPKITVTTTAPDDVFPLQQPIDVKLSVTTNDPNHFLYAIDKLEPGTEWVPIDATKSGTFRFTPTKAGPLVIRAWSVDRAGNLSKDSNALTIRVETGPFTGRWYLDEGTGTTSKDTSGKAHDFTVGTPASWAHSDRWDSTATGPNDWSVSLPGTSSIATAASNIIDTSRSFTVSARVKAGAKATRQVAVSEDRAGTGGFMLGFDHWDLTDPDERKAVWSFAIPDPDGTGQVVVQSPAIGYELGDWIYLTGYYNSADRKLSLTLDDDAFETTIDVPGTVTAPDGTGQLRIGSALDAGVQNHFLDGQVDDVRIYPGPIDEAALSQNYDDSTPTS